MTLVYTNEQYENKIESLIDIAKNTFDLTSSSDLRIITTNKFKEDFFEYSSKTDRSLMNTTELPDLNGALILPRDGIPDFRILINERQFETNDYIHTLFHELVHYIDYKQYFSRYGNVYEMNERKRDELYFYEYSYWSEFHAKQLGIILFYYKIMLDEYGGILEDWKNIIQVGFQSDTLVENTIILNPLKRKITGNEFDEYLKFIFGYYGRASIFQNKNISTFPVKDFPITILLANFGKAIIEVYYFLLVNNEYEAILNNLNMLKQLLKEIRLYIDNNKSA